MCSLLFSFEVMSLLRSSWFYELGIILLSKHFLEWSVGCIRLPKFWLSPVHWETHGHICVCVCVLSARLPEGQIHQYSATCSMILKTCHRDHDRREVRPLKEHHTAGKKESHKTEHGNSLFVASFISRSFSHLARPTRAAGFAYNRSHWTNIDSWARMI